MNRWFDLHMDTLYELKKNKQGLKEYSRHFSLDKCQNIDELTVFFAVFVPEDLSGKEAINHTLSHLPYLDWLKETYPELGENRKILLSIENGAALGGELSMVADYVNRGFKMMTLTWNNGNDIASGHLKPGGLSKFGREVVVEMETKGMVIDLSHINEQGFDEVCQLTSQPFVASHSNMRSVFDHSRNLTDEQFKEIVRRGGLVGFNLHEPFVGDGRFEPKEAIFRHIYRMLELGGQDVIASGSDFDGADVSSELDCPDKLMSLKAYLSQMGLTDRIIEKIFYENASAFFESRNEVG
ncbi:membrane dipeptidase [Eubacteriaceae bacterium ES3]|nr:membrane dipeptidase [Eubacteriaceae bacterium ES3]